MKHLQKFNEAKKRELEPTEKIDNLFFEFIEELSQLGEIAHSELSHSNFVSEEKSSVDETLNEYGKLLSKVNQKFESLRAVVKSHYDE